MTAKLSRYSIIILVTISLSILLPSLYWMIFDKPLRTPQISYSPIIKDFVYTQTGENSSGEKEYLDNQGKSYDRKSYEALLPFSFYYNLDKWGILPDSIDGIPISTSYIRRNSQIVRIRSVYFHTPMIQISPLFESQSDFTRLEMPNELFRISDKLEFLNARSNSVVDSLSDIYNQAFTERGFQFPAKYIAGNPTTRKAFDEGYFIIDAANTVFHLKQIKGKPYCVRTGIPIDLNLRYITVEENSRREFYAIAVTWENQIYLITYDDYKLVRLPVNDFNADEMDLMFYIDPIYRTIKYYSDQELKCIVTDKDYNIIDTYETRWLPKSEWTSSKIAAAIFPFQAERENARTDYILFNLKFNGWLALIGTFLALLTTLAVKTMVYRENLKENWFDLLLVAVTGLYGALAVLLIRPEPWD
ncbi:MAG: DUF4857 domain-containing protein [Candidatus Marinimicrobia bacterium]|nr:DUF4857 domain-containing protein [Candidatus Neomarinimicrobiota bacterium]